MASLTLSGAMAHASLQPQEPGFVVFEQL